MQHRHTSLVIVVIVALVSMGAAGYFYTQHSRLRGEAKIVRDELGAVQREKSIVETELAVLKATDLAKEVESLKSELKSKEEILVAERRNLAETELRLKTAEANVKDLEASIKKAKPYVDVLSAFNSWQFAVSSLHLIDRDTGSIDNAISDLDDSSVSNLWREVKAGLPQARQTGNFRHEEVIILVTSKLAALLR